jgi:NAD-dependent deacetylase
MRKPDRTTVDERALAEAAALLRAAHYAVALTGAGVSVESGIPDFRSPGGLWSVFGPEEYATIGVFRADPAKAWRLYRALGEALAGREPNPAHRALAALERAGLLRLLVTQNIDGLHQAAGSRNVIEIHGDHRRLQCVRCGHREPARPERLVEGVPVCPDCGAPLKPNVVLFGEPVRDLDAVEEAAGRCDLLLVVGTSAQVYPAAALPSLVQAGGGAVIEFNVEETALSAALHPRDVFIRGPAGATLPRFAEAALGRQPA